MTQHQKAQTVEQLAVALKAKAGNISQAATAVGLTRQHLHRRINESPTLQQVVKDVREELVDIAELALRREVVAGNMTAIIWTLKASPEAKRRGWSERTEHTGAEGGEVVLHVVYAERANDSSAEAA